MKLINNKIFLQWCLCFYEFFFSLLLLLVFSYHLIRFSWVKVEVYASFCLRAYVSSCLFCAKPLKAALILLKPLQLFENYKYTFYFLLSVFYDKFIWFQEWMKLLKEMVKKLPFVASFNSLKALYDENVEINFFDNIIHVQVRFWAQSF